MKFFLALVLLFILPVQVSGEAQPEEQPAPCTLALNLVGTVGPATFDYIERAEEQAAQKKCQSIFLRINTPGGSLASTRKIVEKIMGSSIPYLCLISPSGGHAGSAGAIIMQACHVNGGMEATNIGAATPINSSGKDIEGALQTKIYEDTRSWVEGLAKFRGRNVEFAREIVVDGKALDSRKAAEIGALDTVVASEDQFLNFAGKMTVNVDGEEKATVGVGPLEAWEPDLRHDVMQVLSDPQWAYLIFMASLGLIYFELTHAGVFLPGVAGVIGLVISMMNFHMLAVSWGAVALILLGVAFMFAELFITSFGALGFGGVVSFFIGSLFLFDEKTLGQGLPLPLILGVTFCLSLFMGAITYLAIKTLRKKASNQASESWLGRQVKVKSFSDIKGKGFVVVDGELWKCRCRQPLEVGQEVRILKVDGLTLDVEKI